MKKILLVSQEFIFDKVLEEIASADDSIDCIKSDEEYIYSDYPDHHHIIFEYMLEENGFKMIVSGRHEISEVFQDLALELRKIFKLKVPIFTLPNSGANRMIEHSRNRSRKMSWFKSIKNAEQDGKNTVCILQVGGLGSVLDFANGIQKSISEGA